MKNVRLVEYKSLGNDVGKLTPIEGEFEVPFDIKRVYYIYGVSGKETRRGFHAHKDLQQVLLCVHGSVKILTKTPFEEEITLLSKPNVGLFIGNMIWREMFEFSEDAVLLVLASKHFDEKDYMRNYNEYELVAREYFGGNV